MEKIIPRHNFMVIVCVLTIIAVLAGSVSVYVRKGISKAAGNTVDVDILIDGSSVEQAAANVNGLTYKGFGVLSGNSTSNLLTDYRYQHYDAYKELLQVLFGGEHPLMTHVKMEMGNDGNNSTGADACTMRYEDEEADASRSPGFILAADAKKINPDVKVSILRWEMPAWVQRYWNSDRTGKGYEAVYKWYKETVLDAYEKYGYILDYINPDKNETTTPDTDFIKWFKKRLVNDDEFPSYMDEAAIQAYHNIKIVASDEYISLNIVPEMRKDEELYDSVDAVGFHYTTGTSTSTKDYVAMADNDDKEIWYSEGCGSFSYTEYQKNKNVAYGAGTIGGYQSPLAMCDCMIKSAVYSRKTHYIFQPAIGSFYEGSQYDHKELVSAREPWSGNIHYDQSIYCLEHFSKFAKTGWENSSNTAGIWRYIADASDNNSDGTEHLTNENGNPSYMTLASPDKKDFSTIVVNNSNKSLTYKVDTYDMDIAEGAKLEKWTTGTDSYMQYTGDITNDGNGYVFEVEPFSIVTVTTLKCNGKEEYSRRLPADKEGIVLDTDATGSYIDTTDNDILYSDDFDYAKYYPEDYLSSRGYEPRYIVDYSGAFIVEDGRLKQQLSDKISQWQDNTPNAVIGDHRWMNYNASVDVEIPYGGYAGIAIREQTGLAYTGSGYSLRIDDSGSWTFNKRNTGIASGKADKDENGIYRLSLTGQGNKITASINGNVLKEYEDDNAEYFGRVRLFSGWNEAYFDNLVISKLSENPDITTIPYGKSLIDNASDIVKYEGTWNIASNGSSNDWYRSTSKSSSEGASFTFNMKADGFALIGQNSSGTVDVICDGKMLSENEAIRKSEQHCAFLMEDGLGESEHEIKVVLKSGSINLDAIMPFGNIPEIVQKMELPHDDTPEPGNTNDNNQNSSTQSPAVTPIQTPVPGGNTAVSGGQTVDNNSNDKFTKSKVKIKSAKRKKGKVILTWKKLISAKGYVIERSNGNKKKFKTVKTIKSSKTVKYTDKKAPKKVCYYRIRAYKSVKGKKVFSRYSVVLKVKKS